MAGALARQPDQLAERVDAGSGELIALPDGFAALECIDKGLRDIIDVNRLKAGVRSRKRHDGREPLQRAKQVEEPILGAEHDRRPQDRPVEIARHHGFLAVGL